VKVGISSPIVALSGNRPAWEEHAGISELVQVQLEVFAELAFPA